MRRNFPILATAIAFAAGLSPSHGFVTQSGKWPAYTTIVFHTNFPKTRVPRRDGKSSATFDQIFREAAAAWNVHLGSIRIKVRPKGPKTPIPYNLVSEAGFTKTANGYPWGSSAGLAYTFTSDSVFINEVDIIFNGTRSGWTYESFLNIALHEIGHTLGLDHPFEYGQRVASVMNYTGETRIQPDDIRGITSLYGKPVRVRKKGGGYIVTGSAPAGSTITVKFGRKTRHTFAGRSGIWKARIAAKTSSATITMLTPQGARWKVRAAP